MTNNFSNDELARYSKILLDEMSFHQAKLKNLESKFITAKGCVKVLSREIMNTLLELQQIDRDINDLTRLAFFPYHDVPIIDLLTDGRYTQSPVPGTIIPKRNS